MSFRNAFLAASKRFVDKDLEVSMAGRSFMITGANSGIGKASAMAIAKRGTTPEILGPTAACAVISFSTGLGCIRLGFKRKL